MGWCPSLVTYKEMGKSGLGKPGNWNRGLRQSSGEFRAWMVLEQGGQALRSDNFSFILEEMSWHTPYYWTPKIWTDVLCPWNFVRFIFHLIECVWSPPTYILLGTDLKKKIKHLMYRTRAVFQKRFLERVTQHLMLPYHDLELSLIALSCLGNRDFHSGQPNVQGKVEFSVTDNEQGRKATDYLCHKRPMHLNVEPRIKL